MALKNDEEKTVGVPMSTYRYLLTVVRRSGASGVRARIFIRHGNAIALIKSSRGRGITHLLPSCGIDRESDGEDMEMEIMRAAKRMGIEVSRIGRYLGCRDYEKAEGETVKCFDFEALADARKGALDVTWAGKSDVAALDIPAEEKRALANYFRKR